MVKQYSFDILDTCLVRTCGRADFVYDILSCRILGYDAPVSTRMDFSYLRKIGEHNARKALIDEKNEDITIEEIYGYCDFSSLTDVPNSEILNKELEVESEVLVPVRCVKEEITNIHNSGNNVIFISDMYLHANFLKDILIKTGLFVPGDNIFVSGDIRKSKAKGSLFKHVHEILNIPYANWVHTGDNKISDKFVPRKYGIKTEGIKNKFSFYENKLISLQYGSLNFDTIMLASLSRAVRLSNTSTPSNIFASEFVAPIYVPFVNHIFEDAKERGIKTLFFLARDGRIFYDIAKEMAPQYPEISIKYLYVSRSSLYLPGMKDISKESIQKLFFPISSLSLEGILKRMQIEDIKLPQTLYDITDKEELLEKLLQTDIFVQSATQRYSEQKELCLKYLLSEGLGVANTAIVDLTGTRRCHKALNNILENSGYSPAFGYYLEVMKDRVTGRDYSALNYATRYEVNWFNAAMVPHNLFEQYFSITNTRRTKCYEMSEVGMVAPVFEDDGVAEEYKTRIYETNKNVCKQYARMYVKLFNHANHYLLMTQALQTFEYFNIVPDKYLLKAFEGLKYYNWSSQGYPVVYKTSNLKYVIRNRLRSNEMMLMYNTSFPELMRKLLQIVAHIRIVKRQNYIL